MYKLEDIKSIHLEVTQKCQAACTMCDRNKNGGELNQHLNLDELTLEDCKKIFPPSFIKQLKSFSMCGNLGDPIMAKDTVAIFEYIRVHNAKVSLAMHTNAGARDSAWWTSLANIFGSRGAVTFSVDGLEDTNHIYRQNVVWSKVVQSMETFIAAGGIAKWHFLVFEHNQHQVEEAKALSEKMGFDSFLAKKTGRFVNTKQEPKEVHLATHRKKDEVLVFRKPDETFQNEALKTQGALLSKYGSMPKYYDDVKINCKVIGDGSLFITAEGLAMPCCWTAGHMYKWWHADYKKEQIWQYIDGAGGKEALDARNGLDKVFATGIFDSIKASWDKPSCKDGKLAVCAKTCGVEFDPFSAQFK